MMAKVLIFVAFLCAASAHVIFIEVPDNDIPAVPVIPDESQALVQETDAVSDAISTPELAGINPEAPSLRSIPARDCQIWACYNSCRLAGYNNGYCIYGGCICGI